MLISRGVLFFADNPTSTEKLLLQVVNSAVWFEFSDVTLTRTVRSLPLQMGRWYRVLATRYTHCTQRRSVILAVVSQLLVSKAVRYTLAYRYHYLPQRTETDRSGLGLGLRLQWGLRLRLLLGGLRLGLELGLRVRG